MTCIERNSRYWVSTTVGRRDEQLFEQGVQASWQWAKSCQFVRWFSDGERRDANQLWKLASVYLNYREYPKRRYRQVWREGVEVAIKVKGSQGKRRVEWLKPEHPGSAISAKSEVHANHSEALNSSIRRRCSAYRRRQNHYAKTSKGLQQAVTFQRLVPNWIRAHWSLGKLTTPAMAMAMGFAPRPIKMEEFLNLRGFASLTNEETSAAADDDK
jgi:hypothetical protein